MFSKKLDRTDKTILGSSLLVLVISILLILDDSWLFQLNNSNEKKLIFIGTIKSSKNDVRRKHQNTFFWLPLKINKGIYQGDSIFTGDESQAVIYTKDQEIITVAANSLLIVDKREDSLKLDITFGSVRGKVERGKKLLIVKNQEITEFAGSDALVEINTGQGDEFIVNVIEGEVNVKTNNQVKTLRKNDITEIKSKKIQLKQNLFLTATYPKDQSRILVENNSINFKWRSNDPEDTYTITISKDPAFRDKIIEEEVRQKFYNFENLPFHQEVFWKVTSKKVKSSVNASFTAVKRINPKLIFPKKSSHFYFDDSNNKNQAIQINLSWEKEIYANKWEIQISKNNDFQEIVQNITADTNYIQTAPLIKGEYFWRVRSSEFPNMPWSIQSNFNISNRPMLMIASPSKLQKDDFLFINTKKHNYSAKTISELPEYKKHRLIKNPPIMQWTKVQKAKGYILEISRSSKFETPLVRTETRDNKFRWKDARPGVYYWRVQAISPKYKTSAFSQPFKTYIYLMPPIAKKLDEVIEETTDHALINTPPPPLKIKWNANLYTNHYELHISNTPDFTKYAVFLEKENRRIVQLKTPGQIYWKVRSLNKEKKPISNFSEVRLISYRRKFVNPPNSTTLSTVFPKDFGTVIMVGSGKESINFKWSNTYPGANYQIEIAKDKDFNDVIHSARSSINSYSYSNFLSENVLFWRVRAETEDLTTPWTATSKFLVTREKFAFNYQASEDIFYAKLRAQKRQKQILAQLRKQRIYQRSVAARANLRLDRPFTHEKYKKHIAYSKFSQQKTNQDLILQPFHKFFEQVQSYPLLKWNPVKDAERYIVYIAHDSQFKDIVVKYPTTETEYQWDTLRPGHFYWRVQAFNDKRGRSPFSFSNQLTVEAEAPVVRSQPTLVQHNNITTNDKFSQPFKLEWNPVSFARGYQLEFSNDPTFKEKKIFSLSSNEHEFNVDQIGSYFWRVRATSRYGLPIGGFSKTQILQVLEANRNPANIKKLAGIFPIKNKTIISVGKGIINILLRWDSPFKDKTHVIEISKSPLFKNIITRLNTTQSQARITKELPEGQLFWRVGVKKGSDLKWSKPNKFKIKKEQESYDLNLKGL